MPNKVIMRKFFTYFLAVLFVSGCTASKPGKKNYSGSIDNLQIRDTQNLENKIVFLTIRITQTDSLKDTYSFKVTNTIIVKGRLKTNAMNTFSPEPNYLYCEITDANKKRTDYTRVENPLLKIYEFDEKPGSPLQKRFFKTTQGEFNLRFQFDKNSRYLSIYKFSSDYKTLKRLYHAAI